MKITSSHQFVRMKCTYYTYFIHFQQDWARVERRVVMTVSRIQKVHPWRACQDSAVHFQKPTRLTAAETSRDDGGNVMSLRAQIVSKKIPGAIYLCWLRGDVRCLILEVLLLRKNNSKAVFRLDSWEYHCNWIPISKQETVHSPWLDFSWKFQCVNVRLRCILG